jgi:hypothetical protein
MRTPTVLLALLLSIPVLAGCLSTPAAVLETPPTDFSKLTDWAARAVPADPDHLHNRSDQHRGLSSPNMELLGWDPATRAGSKSMGGGGCGAVNSGPGRKLAVFTSVWDNAQGLAVADVTDPANPKKIGELVSPSFRFRDAEITPDGKWAVVANFPVLPRPTPPLAPRETDAGSDACPAMLPPPAMGVFGGVALIDLRDPTQPRVADFAPDPVGGPHSVFATTIDGTSYVMAAHNGLPSDAGRFWFYTISNGQLMPYGVHTIQAPRAQTAQPLSNLHTDSWIHKHPKTGQILAYLANWDSGLVILRLDGPGRIVPVGTWSNYDPSQGSEMTGQVHSVEPASTLWDGKHYTFIGQELIGRPKNRPTGQMIMLDTTDPAKPTPVARWTLPVDPGVWDKKTTWCCLFSTHYLELVNQTLFIAMYHGGVWAIDVRPGHGTELPSLGVFVPNAPDPSYQTPTPTGPAPFVEEIYALDNGDLVTFDDWGGLYTFRFHPEIALPIPTPWTADAWIK